MARVQRGLDEYFAEKARQEAEAKRRAKRRAKQLDFEAQLAGWKREREAIRAEMRRHRQVTRPNTWRGQSTPDGGWPMDWLAVLGIGMAVLWMVGVAIGVVGVLR